MRYTIGMRANRSRTETRIMSFEFQPRATLTVAQWRGMDGGWRCFGSGLSRPQATRRAALVERIFPEFARAKLVEEGGPYPA